MGIMLQMPKIKTMHDFKLYRKMAFIFKELLNAYGFLVYKFDQKEGFYSKMSDLLIKEIRALSFEMSGMRINEDYNNYFQVFKSYVTLNQAYYMLHDFRYSEPTHRKESPSAQNYYDGYKIVNQDRSEMPDLSQKWLED